ncbi:MAG: response regulator [Oscillospiraceae bacterium]|nr:response regulator [Oscillospiraceae bacterium]
MYKALIVDDERMIREGIRHMIPWEDLRVGGIFTANSGENALMVMDEHEPDIMLTDICMSEMDGLSLIERVNERYPRTRIIVLTGYEHFEYVQRCCRMNVQDFILKPTDEDILTAVIRDQILELDKQRGIEQRHKVMRRAQGAAEQIRMEKAMRALVHGRSVPEDGSGLPEELQYRGNQPLQAIIILLPEQDGHWREHFGLLTMSVKNICIELFDSKLEGVTFEDEHGQLVLILYGGDTANDAAERMEKLRGMLNDEFSIDPGIMIGHMVAGLKQLPESYGEAQSLLLLSSADKKGIVESNSAKQRLHIFDEIFQELKCIITSAGTDMDQIIRAFTTFSDSAQSHNLSVSTVRRCCFELACSAYYHHIGSTGEGINGEFAALLSSLALCGSEEACRVTLNFFSRLQGVQRVQSHEMVQIAKKYILENLAEELSVSNIAAMQYVTPNYFSRLFKQVTGEGCNEYIVRKRMEQAKSLLTSKDLKIGVIAGMVGYRDINYFSLAFKKNTGCSPTAYREAAQRP